MSMEFELTVLIPVKEPSLTLLTTMFAVLNQTHWPVRVIIADGTEKGIDKVFALREATKKLTVEVHRRDSTQDTTAFGQRWYLMKQVTTVWAMLVDADCAPLPDCFGHMITTQRLSGADMVSAVKLEMTRTDPWSGKDINPGFTPRTGRGYTLVPWADSACLLVRAKDWLDTAVWVSAGPLENGDNVYTTAQIAAKGRAVQSWEAVAWHLPDTLSRWIDVDVSDELVMTRLKGKVPAKDWQWLRIWHDFKKVMWGRA